MSKKPEVKKQAPYVPPKYPRVQVSNKRHALLHKEAVKEGTTMELVVEAKLKLADDVLKEARKREAQSK